MTFGKTLRGAEDLTVEELRTMLDVVRKDRARAEACVKVFEAMATLNKAIADYEEETGETGVRKLVKKVRGELGT